MIARACERAGLLDTNQLMNERIAEIAAEYLSGTRRGLVTVVDVGAGNGATSVAFLKKLLEQGPKNIRLGLGLVEPSRSRLEEAEKRISELIRGTYLEQGTTLELVPGTAERTALLKREARPQNMHADLVITNAAIHHESFNQHLHAIRSVMMDDMALLVSGDWHESNYEHPARVYWIYYLLQDPHNEERAQAVFDFVREGTVFRLDERKELREFCSILSLTEDDLYSAFDNHSESELLADIGSMKYWRELGKEFSDAGKKCPEFLLQCHERVSRRVENLKNAGFVFDNECRQKYSEVLKKRGYGELASVMVAKKRMI